MEDEHETKGQFINESAELRRRIDELEASETEYRQAEEALQKQQEILQVIFDSMPVMVHYRDKENRFVLINKRLAEATGIPKEKIKGKTASEVDLDESKNYWSDDREIIDSGLARKNIIETFETVEGTRWVQTNKIPYRDEEGNIVGVIGFATDITGWVRAEEELKEYSERLEEMVEQRTAALTEAQEQLVRREKLAILGQLAGSMGHELRNPLGVMSNAVYYLKTILSDTDETTEEYLDIISSEVSNADKIVSDLLDFSRTRPAEWEETAVSKLVAQVLEKHPPPENVGVKTEIPLYLPSLFVDPRQIHQVLVNLVTNAYDAMPEGGKLVISAKMKEGCLDLSITDTGCGMSEEDMEKSFEPLFTTKARGIGLGLAVSRNLVEANKGSIEVESKEGEGSAFTVTLPIKGAVS